MGLPINLKFKILHFTLWVVFVCLLASCNNNASKETSSPSGDYTYAATIAPIIFKNCSPCHRSNNAGPFNLLTYADAKRNANKIKFVTQTHYMPPWPADASYTHFIDERILTT